MRDLTIVFDLDGTLVDTAPDLIRAANYILAGEGLPPAASDILRPAISLGARGMIKRALEHNDAPRSEAAIDALLDRFLDFYADNIALESRPFPGLLAALDQAVGAGARLAVCTNKREHLSRQLLDALALSSRFAAIAGRDTFPVFKPHPDHLTGVIDLAGGDPTRAIMVGDSDTDIRTAKAAGVPVIGVTFGYTDVPIRELGADAVIDHYDEFADALVRLIGQR